MDAKHLDTAGRPLCGAPAAGALVVDEPVDVTCGACLLEYGEQRRKAAASEAEEQISSVNAGPPDGR